MKKKILLTVCIFSIVSTQGEHPTGSKTTASITPQIVQGEKITLQNLARAIESFVEADINLRGAFLVIDPSTNEVLKLYLEKVHKERLSHVGDDVYFACADFNADDGKVYDLDIFLRGTNTDELTVTEITVHKEDGQARYGWMEQDGVWIKKYN